MFCGCTVLIEVSLNFGVVYHCISECYKKEFQQFDLFLLIPFFLYFHLITTYSYLLLSLMMTKADFLRPGTIGRSTLVYPGFF